MPNSSITSERRVAAAWLTLTRSQIDAAVVRELRDACEAISDDANVRAVVLTGTGASFAAGWDAALLSDMGALKQAGALGDPFGCLAELPKPVICALNGDAIGAALALALAADIRIASDSAKFGLPEASAGMLPMAGATQRLSRLVGRGKALEMILTGEPIDAAEALRIGLVSEVVPAGQLAARTQEIADRIAERGPLALQYAKEAVARGIDMSLEQAMRFETDLTVILQTTEDRAEGVRAFLEKRKPEFKGR